jgi:hypothetical protein
MAVRVGIALLVLESEGIQSAGLASRLREAEKGEALSIVDNLLFEARKLVKE